MNKLLLLPICILTLFSCRKTDSPSKNTAPQVMPQSSAKKIILDSSKLELTFAGEEWKLNTVEKDGLSDEGLEKPYHLHADEDLDLDIKNSWFKMAGGDCLSEIKPSVGLRTKLADKIKTTLHDSTEPISLKKGEDMQLTVVVSNPGECKKIKVSFGVMASGKVSRRN